MSPNPEGMRALLGGLIQVVAILLAIFAFLMGQVFDKQRNKKQFGKVLLVVSILAGACILGSIFLLYEDAAGQSSPFLFLLFDVVVWISIIFTFAITGVYVVFALFVTKFG